MCVTLHPLSSFSIRMQKAFLLLFLFLFPSSNVSTRTATPEKKVATSVPAPQKMDGEQLFEDMQLGGVVNFLAFRQAVAGYNLIKQKSKSILTLIDFTKPSTEKRLFVFDVCKSGRLGRSFGCPALPQALTKPIINTIKGGSVLFIYANNKEYMAKSSILPNQTSQELFTEACESEQTVSAHL